MKSKYDDPCFSPGEVADRLKVNTRTVIRMIRQGKLGATRIGGGHRYGISEKDIDEYKSEHRVNAG
jgi:excisionase family DNA binding protein